LVEWLVVFAAIPVAVRQAYLSGKPYLPRRRHPDLFPFVELRGPSSQRANCRQRVGHDIRIMLDRCRLDALACRLALDEVDPIGCRSGFPEATPMRIAYPLLILLSCAGCALSQKPVAQAPQQTAAAAPIPAPAADTTPKFECSDGTISFSQTGCLVNMARARLPAGQPNDAAPDTAR
jgi:hypothetical protein